MEPEIMALAVFDSILISLFVVEVFILTIRKARDY